LWDAALENEVHRFIDRELGAFNEVWKNRLRRMAAQGRSVARPAG
jgi:hypothetical protein